MCMLTYTPFIFQEQSFQEEAKQDEPTILEEAVFPSIEKVASSVEQRDAQFADVMGALSQLKSSLKK